MLLSAFSPVLKVTTWPRQGTNSCPCGLNKCDVCAIEEQGLKMIPSEPGCHGHWSALIQKPEKTDQDITG